MSESIGRDPGGPFGGFLYHISFELQHMVEITTLQTRYYGNAVTMLMSRTQGDTGLQRFTVTLRTRAHRTTEERLLRLRRNAPQGSFGVPTITHNQSLDNIATEVYETILHSRLATTVRSRQEMAHAARNGEFMNPIVDVDRSGRFVTRSNRLEDGLYTFEAGLSDGFPVSYPAVHGNRVYMTHTFEFGASPRATQEEITRLLNEIANSITMTL